MSVPRTAGLLLVGIGWLGACGDRSPEAAPPPDADLALQVGEARVEWSELEALLPYFDSVDRRVGRSTRIRHLLDNHLLPLAAARLAFKEKRAEQRRHAEALAAVVGNGGYPALRAQGRQSGQESAKAKREDFPLPVAAWLFDPKNIGQVSPVTETPQGFTLASAYDVQRGETPLQDRVEAFQATFYTHTPDDFSTWWNAERQRLVGATRYVHPDLADALPSWLTP
jgi:hypothetical protein